MIYLNSLKESFFNYQFINNLLFGMADRMGAPLSQDYALSGKVFNSVL